MCALSDAAGGFLHLAAEVPLEVTTTPFPLAEADQALAALATDRIRGAAVLINTPDGSNGPSQKCHTPLPGAPLWQYDHVQ